MYKRQDRYLGFAVDIPSAGFQPPARGGVQLAQWFQGSPYSPPLSITITRETSAGATFQVLVYNNTTGGNPSSQPIIVGTGTMSLDTWTPLVVHAVMNYQGQGEVGLWENGVQLFDWTGSVGYDPTTIPYKNPPAGTSPPNSLFDVFFGPYREQQATTQTFYFDEIRWADTYADASPVPGVPEPSSLALLVAGSMLFAGRRAISGIRR